MDDIKEDGKVLGTFHRLLFNVYFNGISQTFVEVSVDVTRYVISMGVSVDNDLRLRRPYSESLLHDVGFDRRNSYCCHFTDGTNPCT